MVEHAEERLEHRPVFDDEPQLGEHRTLAEKAFISLHRAILTGGLEPGARLLIDDLAKTLGMSAMPVREAVRRLGAMGLVVNVPHKGARVTELSVQDLREVYEARLVLEPLAIYRAAMVFTDEDARLAQIALDSMSDLPVGSIEQWSAHSSFHLGLYQVGGSSWLMRLIQPLWESSERYRLALSYKDVEGARRDAHEKILRACVNHDDGYAAFELYNHLATTANATSSAMGGEELFRLLEGAVWVSPVKLPERSVAQ